MTVEEALGILNKNTSERIYSKEETKILLKFYTLLSSEALKQIEASTKKPKS